MSFKKKLIKASLATSMLMYFSMTALTDETKELFDLLKQKKFDQVKKILDNGRDVNIKDQYGRSLLYTAVSQGNKEMTEYLIKKGANINVRDKWQTTPLHMVSDPETAKLLLANGADINAKDKEGKTPLHRAARSNKQSIVKLLINNGADIKAKDNKGKTPRVYAFVFKRKEARSLLKEAEEKASGHLAPKDCLAKVFEVSVFPGDIGLDKESKANENLTCTACSCSRDTPCDRLSKYIYWQVREDFIDKNKLRAQDAEILEMQNHMIKSMEKAKIKWIKELEEIKIKLKDPSLSEAKRKELKAHQKTLKNIVAKNVIKHPQSMEASRSVFSHWIELWKFNKSVYDKYGEIVEITKFGPMPAGAIKALLEDYQKQGEIQIYDETLKKAFWKSYSKKPRFVAKPEEIDFTPYWKKKLPE